MTAKQDHDRLVASGLLGGMLTDGALASWPPWAQAHLADCRACQGVVHADQLLRALGVPAEPRALPGTFPGIAALLARPRPAPPPLGAIVEDTERFAVTYRGGALEVTRTGDGIQAWDPDARHLALFSVGPTSITRLIGEAQVAAAGVGEVARVTVDGPTRVIAIATAGRLDVELCELWLRDVLHADWRAPLETTGVEDRVHVASLVLLPPASTWLLRVQDTPLPAALPHVRECLLEARAAGQAGAPRDALALYRGALSLATEAGDGASEVKASIGIAMSLDGLGYADDAAGVLAELVGRSVFDRSHGGLVARRLAHHAIGAGDMAAARRWHEEAVRIEGPETGWVGLLGATLALRAGDWPALASIEIPDDALPGSTQEVASCLRTIGRAHAGEPGVGVSDAARESRAAQPELVALRATTWAAQERARGPVDYDALIARALRDLTGAPPPSRWTTYLLAELAEGARRQGDTSAAARLLDLALLGAVQSEDTFAAAAVRGGLLVRAPGLGVRLVSVVSERVQDLVAKARAALCANDRPDAAELRALRALLLPSWQGSGHLDVVSDGSLVGVPWYGLLHEEGATITELLPHAVRGHARSTDRVVSIADAQGDLPGASAEVLRSEADGYLRGPDATRAALTAAGPAGLLHLGVHGRRTRGVPELMFADGPLTAPDVERLGLEGGPFVVLSGCATGAGAVHAGVERSFAAAFLSAGASAVLATHWPVIDSHMHRLIRRLMARWPFADPALEVGVLCRQLRDEGLPARLWAAPVVYATR